MSPNFKMHLAYLVDSFQIIHQFDIHLTEGYMTVGNLEKQWPMEAVY